jgi:hypothetical protein
MDVVWDQDVRIVLSAIISRDPVDKIDSVSQEPIVDEKKLKAHVQLAIRYANELANARKALEGRTGVQQYRPRPR